MILCNKFYFLPSLSRSSRRTMYNFPPPHLPDKFHTCPLLIYLRSRLLSHLSHSLVCLQKERTIERRRTNNKSLGYHTSALIPPASSYSLLIGIHNRYASSSPDLLFSQFRYCVCRTDRIPCHALSLPLSTLRRRSFIITFSARQTEETRGDLLLPLFPPATISPWNGIKLNESQERHNVNLLKSQTRTAQNEKKNKNKNKTIEKNPKRTRSNNKTTSTKRRTFTIDRWISGSSSSPREERPH